MAVQSKPDQPVFVSPEEYLAFERASECRHEYDGQVKAQVPAVANGQTRIVATDPCALFLNGLTPEGSDGN